MKFPIHMNKYLYPNGCQQKLITIKNKNKTLGFIYLELENVLEIRMLFIYTLTLMKYRLPSVRSIDIVISDLISMSNKEFKSFIPLMEVNDLFDKSIGYMITNKIGHNDELKNVYNDYKRLSKKPIKLVNLFLD